MNILVTGGAGFIGSHVADAYLLTQHTVVIVDDLSSGTRENVPRGARFYRVDIRDEERLSKVFRREKIQAVNHHAAQMDLRKSVEDPAFDASVNVVGSLNLLELCRKHDVRKFIFASTGGAIYGEQERFPADEDHPLRPLSPYGVAKFAVERYLSYYSALHGLEYVSLRYGNVFGPRQNPHGEAGVVSIFAQKMLNGGQPLINGDGKQTRDYVYVEDAVRANLLALTSSTSNVFNVGTGIETDVNTIFQKLRSITNARSGEKHGPPKEGEQLRSVLSYVKIQSALGWSPQVDLDEGLRRTVAFLSQKT
ncbi:MAG TPA: NAD-dependent epimerase/dehydratase family protein [Bacteroidota bacterium]